jgi:DNA-binding CsgD family transcriptional regulator
MSEATPNSTGTPTVVLVHGAWIVGTGWAGVIAPFQPTGDAAFSPTNPLRDIADPLGELQRVLGAIAEGLLVPETSGEFLAVQEVAALPAHVDSDAPPDLDPPSMGLSGREVEVLRLVADGLTNLQIAEQLFISPKTVSTHLMNIFGKLGVTTRAAATRLAIECGLV